jgi:trehalose 6-phosphate phosphatase
VNGPDRNRSSLQSAGVPPPERCGPEHCAYFLDLDGTLVAIAGHPAAVHVDAALVALIERLGCAADGAIALISGRPITDIDRLFEPLRLPVAGQHGAERRDASGRFHVHAIDGHALAKLRQSVATWQVMHPGLVVEDKGLTLALHYRAAPELAAPLDRLVREKLDAMASELQVQPGKMVLEVKPGGRDKGRAIREFLDEAPFSGRLPVFIGDDVTDEYGFAAVNTLGGVSIKVGDGDSCARWQLENVAAVHRWLRAVLMNAHGPVNQQS